MFYRQSCKDCRFFDLLNTYKFYKGIFFCHILTDAGLTSWCVAELETGSVLWTWDRGNEVVEDATMEQLDEPVKVYNPNIGASCIYYVSADGVLVHNTYWDELLENIIKEAMKDVSLKPMQKRREI